MQQNNISILLATQSSEETGSIVTSLIKHYQNLEFRITNNPILFDVHIDWRLFDVIILNNLPNELLIEIKTNISGIENELHLIIISDQTKIIFPNAQIIKHNDIPQNLIHQIDEIIILGEKKNIENTNLSKEVKGNFDVSNQTKARNELKRRYEFEKHVFNISSMFINSNDFNKKIDNSLKEIGLLCNADKAFFVEINHQLKKCNVINEWINTNVEPKPNMFLDISLDKIRWAVESLSVIDHYFLKDINHLPEEASEIKDYCINSNIKNFIAFPVFAGSNINGFIGISNISNITEMTSDEFIFLRTAGEILSNAIQRHCADISISELNNQLLLINKELEQVLYVTSHDIRSPLVNILGFTQELNKSIAELYDLLTNDNFTEEDKLKIHYLIHEDIPESVKYINAGGNKIDKLLSALLKLSRIGRSTIKYSIINAKQVISEIIDTYRFQIESEHLDIQIDELLPCKADLQLINQVFSNLIDNAIKYHLPEKNSYLKVYCTKNDGKLFYYFKDNGIGIPNEKINSVFEIFSRAHPNYAEGEGMGLTIIKKALERMNGKIYVESVEGSGSTFIVELPDLI
jgi:signal transduction histidine kinase